MAYAEDDIKRAMGRAMASLRAELGWSQKRMGLLLGVGQRTVSEIESGKRMMNAGEIMTFPERLAEHLPYDEGQIRDRILGAPRLYAVIAEDRTSNTYSRVSPPSLPKLFSNPLAA